MSVSSVGVTDIHTPSVYPGQSLVTHATEAANIPVVRMALPANDVSSR